MPIAPIAVPNRSNGFQDHRDPEYWPESRPPSFATSLEIERRQKPVCYCAAKAINAYKIVLRGFETMTEPAVVVSYRNALL